MDQAFFSLRAVAFPDISSRIGYMHHKERNDKQISHDLSLLVCSQHRHDLARMIPYASYRDGLIIDRA